MNEYARDNWADFGVDVSEHLLAKDIHCSTRRDGTTLYIAGDFSEAELDSALADFTPPTEADRALEAVIASTGLNMTRDQYNAVRTQMQTLRALRQMGRNAFMGLSQAERDRTLYDAFTATTQVFLAILRDTD